MATATAATEEVEMARRATVKTPDRRPARAAHSDSPGRAEATRGRKRWEGKCDIHDELDPVCRE